MFEIQIKTSLERDINAQNCVGESTCMFSTYYLWTLTKVSFLTTEYLNIILTSNETILLCLTSGNQIVIKLVHRFTDSSFMHSLCSHSKYTLGADFQITCKKFVVLLPLKALYLFFKVRSNISARFNWLKVLYGIVGLHNKKSLDTRELVNGPLNEPIN